MNDIETFVRFQFAKDSNCYIDILRLVLINKWKEDLIKNIPDFNLWLEFWVNQKTQLSLLSLWLSRHTVIEISEYITNTNLTKEECISRLHNNKNILLWVWISSVILKDIERIIWIDFND